MHSIVMLLSQDSSSSAQQINYLLSRDLIAFDYLSNPSGEETLNYPRFTRDKAFGHHYKPSVRI